MKKTLIILTFLPLAIFFSCGEKVNKTGDAGTLQPEEIMELEKENTEIQTLESDLNEDLEELDTLLNDLDRI